MRRFASIAIAALVVGVAAVGATVKAAEEPPHTVVVSDGDFQIRDYPALTIAEVTVRAPRNDAANAGFRKLAGYIFGGNAEKQKIEMTAPVIEAAAGADDKGRVREGWTIRFVMPQGFTLGKLPKPNDPDIRMHETPATRYAVLRYSGLAGDDTVRGEDARPAGDHRGPASPADRRAPDRLVRPALDAVVHAPQRDHDPDRVKGLASKIELITRLPRNEGKTTESARSLNVTDAPKHEVAPLRPRCAGWRELEGRVAGG